MTSSQAKPALRRGCPTMVDICDICGTKLTATQSKIYDRISDPDIPCYCDIAKEIDALNIHIKCLRDLCGLRLRKGNYSCRCKKPNWESFLNRKNLIMKRCRLCYGKDTLRKKRGNDGSPPTAQAAGILPTTT